MLTTPPIKPLTNEKKDVLMKIILRAVPILLTGLLLAPASYSSSLDKNELAIKCESVAKKLEQMVENNPLKSCSVDVTYSGWVVEAAADLIRHERFQYALQNLKAANGRLNKVYLSSQECAYFSPMVKSSLDDVIKLQSELGTNPSFK